MYQSPTPLLLSRVAEAAYWAGRYLERAEGTARLIKSHADLVVDLPLAASVGWSPLLAVMGVEDELVSELVSHGDVEESVVAHLVTNEENYSSIRASIAAVHHNFRLTRAVMPVEAAEVLIQLRDMVESTADAAVCRRTRGDWLASVIRGCQTLTGVLSETMSHDDAYCFLTVGRQIERADMVSRVLDVQGGILIGRDTDQLGPYVDLCLSATLRSVSALQAFRRRGLPNAPTTILGFLIRDAKCPRTIESCLIEASRWLLEVPGHKEPMALCAELETLIQSADINELADSGIHAFVDEVQVLLGALHNEIGMTWFELDRAAVAG